MNGELNPKSQKVCVRHQGWSAGKKLLLISIVLIGGLFVLAAIMPGSHRTVRAAVEAATYEVRKFSEELDAFRQDTGFYPTGTNGLQDLVLQPHGCTNWQGSYIRGRPPEIVLDPWNQPYVYEYPGKHAALGYPFDLYSPGPPGKNKPIANWHDPKLKR